MLIRTIVADGPSVTLRFVEILVGDPAEAWERLGFAAGADAIVDLEGVRLRPVGDGDMQVGVAGLAAERPDGLSIVGADRVPVIKPAPHPNGAFAVDHVVALTDSLDRTVAALSDAGLSLRRRTGPMAFFRLGPCILEVVERAEVTSPALWGLVVVVADLDACAGPLLGEARGAVQPGRRIATVRRDAGLSVAVALMTPRPQPAPAG